MSGDYAGHPKHWNVFSLQELCTDLCRMGTSIPLLQHEVMAAEGWQDGEQQDLTPTYLSI